VLGTAATFSAGAIVITLLEIFQHIHYYCRPVLQKQIVRLLALVPSPRPPPASQCLILHRPSIRLVLAPQPRVSGGGQVAGGCARGASPVCFLCLRQLPLPVQCYEAVTIYSFTWLILSYAEADANLSFSSFPETLASKPRLQHLPPLHHIMDPWPMGSPFIARVQTGVLNYVVVRPLTAFIGFILEVAGLYTSGDLSPGGAYLYLACINSASQAWALYCLVQLYRATSAELAGIRLLAKFLCVKARAATALRLLVSLRLTRARKGIVFAMFWQGLLVALALRLGILKHILHPKTDSPAELAVRLQNYLVCAHPRLVPSPRSSIVPEPSEPSPDSTSRRRDALLLNRPLVRIFRRRILHVVRCVAVADLL